MVVIAAHRFRLYCWIFVGYPHYSVERTLREEKQRRRIKGGFDSVVMDWSAEGMIAALEIQKRSARAALLKVH